MQQDDSHTRISTCALIEVFALAAEAITAGLATDRDWETLRALHDRSALEEVAGALACRKPHGPSMRWWRGTLKLLVDLSFGEETAPQAESDTDLPSIFFDLDQHALEVSSALRYLQRYLTRLREDSATEQERRAATIIARCVHLTRLMV